MGQQAIANVAYPACDPCWDGWCQPALNPAPRRPLGIMLGSKGHRDAATTHAIDEAAASARSDDHVDAVQWMKPAVVAVEDLAGFESNPPCEQIRVVGTFVDQPFARPSGMTRDPPEPARHHRDSTAHDAVTKRGRSTKPRFRFSTGKLRDSGTT